MPDPAIRVLLVEDDEAYVELLRAELASLPVPPSIRCTPHLRAASAALEEAPVDVVLLDLGLPDSSGLDTLRRMQESTRDIPIVVLTGHDSEALAIAAVQAGAEDYLTKGSIDPQLLFRALRYACERAAFRRTLVEREALFRALVDNSYDAVTLLDENLADLYNSRAIERVCGFGPDERRGERLDKYVHPDDLHQMRRGYATCLESPGVPVSLAYRFLHKDGSWRHGEAVAVNHLHDPAVRAIVVNHRDVTGRKQAEQALHASEEQLRQAQKLEAVGRLAGGVAHDFNNVLTAIFGYADLLLEQFTLDDPRRADVEEIRRSAERAAALTRQLLAFSRKQVMQPRVLDLNGVIGSLQKLLSRLVGDEVELNVHAGTGLWQVKADPGQIEQVLMNLCANARDAMPEGGRLTIATENRPVGDHEANARPGLRAGPHVVLTVTDSGHGMPDEVRRQVFEPFFTTKEQGKGTGLGLATVYGIVKQTGGGIYAESEPGKGTRFLVYLPKADVAQICEGAETA